MVTVDIQLDQASYPVYIGRGLLDAAELWQPHLGSGQLMIVSNETIAPLFLDRLSRALADREPALHIIADGEQHKTADTWSGIIDALVAQQARRDSCLIALGGGVVGDLTGFAAACYMRGIRFVQMPTTLLAQVDASVGGKTGINHPRGKNLVGAFHQPAAVIIDSATLDTLPEREYRAGLAEVAKYGAIGDASFFDWLEREAETVARRDPSAVDYLIERSVRNKASVVAADEREAGIRALLNFGHSFGHALESETAYERFLHGEAVAIGMVTAARLSERRGLCPAGCADRIERLLTRLGLPVRLPTDLSPERLAEALQLDKKALASGLRLILLRNIGDAIVDGDSSVSDIQAVLAAGSTA